MSAIRITKQQVEEAAAARERALAEDPDFHRSEHEKAVETEKEEEGKQAGKEAD